MCKLGKALRNSLSSRMGIKSKSLIDPLKIKGSFFIFCDYRKTLHAHVYGKKYILQRFPSV